MRRLKHSLDAACGLLAAAALFFIMALTLVDVTGRKLLALSVPGALEMTELTMVALIFAALPQVSLHGEHIVFDSLDAMLPRGFKRVQAVVVELFCALSLFGVAWVMWGKAENMASFGDMTAELHIPLGPFVHAMSVLSALTALVHLSLIFTPVAHHHVGVRDEQEAAAP